MAYKVPSVTLAPSVQRSPNRFPIFVRATLFVLGFSLIFIVGWGGAATVLGQLFGQYKPFLAQVGGLIVIIFGLHTLGLLRVIWLDYDTRPGWHSERSSDYWSSFLLGVVFAAGWTPCIGTILGAILTLGFSQETTGQAMVLTSGYTLGLGIPFLVLSVLLERAFTLLRWLRHYTRPIQILSGLLLVAMGILVLTNQMFYLAIWAQRNGLYLDPQLGYTTTPTYLLAILAGLLSFLSPCVLPLVPAYIAHLSHYAVEHHQSPASQPR